jgi:small-conductance mechanosensitive channel
VSARGVRLRGWLRAGSSTAFLLMLMFAGRLGLWVGAPVLWLWIGGRVQGATGSLGAAIAVILVGFLITVFLAVPLLGWLSRRYSEARAARGLDDLGRVALEGVMVVSATIAVVLFAIWFLFLAGAEPIPFGAPN